MSVAILVSGQMRTAKKCIDSILQSLPHGDFYIHAVHDNNCLDAELFDPVRLLIEPQFEMAERPEYSWALGNYCVGVQRVLKQLHSLKRTWSIFDKHKTKYEWVIRVRPDLFFTESVEPLSVWKLGITVPKFCNYWGLNDRFAILDIKSAEIYFNRLDNLDEYINLKQVFQPEMFLKWICAANDIPVHRTNTTFYTLRENDEKVIPEYDSTKNDILT